MDKKLSKGAEIRSRLDHPVVDADGHTVEIGPLLQDYIKKVGGADLLAQYTNTTLKRARRTYEACRLDWNGQPLHWTFPARNTLDRATASLPHLYHARMDELGLDFSLVYPTNGLQIQMMAEDELRRVGCRALNMY